MEFQNGRAGIVSYPQKDSNEEICTAGKLISRVGKSRRLHGLLNHVLLTNFLFDRLRRPKKGYQLGRILKVLVRNGFSFLCVCVYNLKNDFDRRKLRFFNQWRDSHLLASSFINNPKGIIDPFGLETNQNNLRAGDRHRFPKGNSPFPFKKRKRTDAFTTTCTHCVN